MIDVTELNHFYGRFHSLKNISFAIPQGSIAGFIGPNGAGKSTTLKVLAGFLVPATGDVRLDGISLISHPLEARRKIGYMQETPILYREMRVEEYLDFVGKLKGLGRAKRRRALEKAIDKCGLEKIHRKLVGNVSKGNRQRVAMAQALFGDPSVLLLDEPTSALDPGQVIDIRHFIKSLKGSTTVLMSSHILSEIAQICDYIVCIQGGEIRYQGSASTIANHDPGTGKDMLVRLSSFQNEWFPWFQALPGANLRGSVGKELCFRITDENLFYPSLFQLVADRRLPLRELTTTENALETFFAGPVSPKEAQSA